MLMLNCFSTGSKEGNCYALSDGEKVLLLDCGIKAQKIARNNNWRIDNISGCCVTHQHL